ncbi:thioredoxin-like protein [Gongronella butleri]|nr:thioredoxin-like protein [Gongronella butleri]
MRWFAVFTILAALACALCEVVELTDATFDKSVRKQDQWVLEFYADWCGYCSRFRPKYEAIERQARDFSTPVYFGAINVDKNPRLAARFFVSRLPTLVHVFDKQVRVLTIPSPPSQLAQFLQEEQWRDIKPEGIFMSAYGPL